MNSQEARPVNVLIVEDDDAARDASSQYLDSLGYETRTASNAAEAERQAKYERPDVVICDWRIRGSRSGADVARTLQKAYRSRVIFITAYRLSQLRRETRDIDVVRYLRKPLSLDTLADTLRQIHDSTGKSVTH